MTYDSTDDTLAHIQRVQSLIYVCITYLGMRAEAHDASKLQSPEKEGFDEHTPKLRTLTYGSPEYEAARNALGVALQHHYAANSHHPEHYENGINGMSLLDILEMFVDWKAATERHADGDFTKSLAVNKQRFGLSDQLAQVFENTRKELNW